MVSRLTDIEWEEYYQWHKIECADWLSKNISARSMTLMEIVHATIRKKSDNEGTA